MAIDSSCTMLKASQNKNVFSWRSKEETERWNANAENTLQTF